MLLYRFPIYFTLYCRMIISGLHLETFAEVFKVVWGNQECIAENMSSKICNDYSKQSYPPKNSLVYSDGRMTVVSRQWLFFVVNGP